MRAGRLDRRIRIERKTVSLGPYGDQIETWVSIAGTRWAAVAPVRGDERFSAPQLIAKGLVTMRIRWGLAVSDVTPLDRVIYEGRVYDIHAVREIGRREGIEIDATVRADVAEDADYMPSLDFSDERNSQYLGVL